MAQAVLTPAQLNQLPLQTKLKLIQNSKAAAQELQFRIAEVRRTLKDTDLFHVSRSIPQIRDSKLYHYRTFKGHIGKVSRIRLTNDDQSIVSIAQDGYIIIWDVYTGLKTHAVPLSNTWDIALAASKSSRLLAVGGLDNAVAVYKVDTIEDQINNYGATDEVNELGFSSSSRGIHGVENANTGKRKKGSLFQTSPTKASFGESYQMTGVGGNSPICNLRGHTGYISDVEFLTEDKILSGSGDMSVMLWDINKGVKIREYLDRNLGDVSSLALHPSNPNIFVSASLRTVKVWDVRLKTSLQTFSDHLDDINVVKMFPDGNAIATGSEDSTCRMFDLRSDCQIACFENPNAQQFINNYSHHFGAQNIPPSSAISAGRRASNVMSPTPPMTPLTPKTPRTPISPNPLADIYGIGDERYDRSGSLDSMSLGHSLLRSSEYQRQVQLYSVCEMQFSPSGRLLFTAYEDGNWGAWDILKGEWMGNLSLPGGKDGKTGNHLHMHSIGPNGSVNGGNSNTNEAAQKNQVTGIQITKDGARIYTSSWDSLIRAYSV